MKINNKNLRYKITHSLPKQLINEKILKISRRSKYLIFHFKNKLLLVHLGMSGSLRIIESSEVWRKHDHIDMQLGNGHGLRYHDPRRFGCWLWSADEHSQLSKLGPEPLDEEFNCDYLYQLSRNRRLAVKPFIMDGAVVVGVGNIYAAEALFRSGISPQRAACRISRKRYQLLATNIKDVLSAAINKGGTTLRDFVSSDGQPGYFQQSLDVYGRAGQPCNICKGKLKEIRLGQRSSVFCPNCQH